jgi:cell division protein ZapA
VRSEAAVPESDDSRMNSVKVEICGSEYRIRGDADPECIQEIAHYVDSKMREVTTETSLGSTLKVAILAALNIAGELFRERDDRNKLLAQVEERAEELTRALDAELTE